MNARFLRRLVALLIFSAACAQPTEPPHDASAELLEKAHLVAARLADVSAVLGRRCTAVHHFAGSDASCDGPVGEPDPMLEDAQVHDVRIELEGAENRLLRARELYNAAAADYNAALARAGAEVVDPATDKRLEASTYLPTASHAGAFVVPHLDGRVTDRAGKLTPAQRSAFESRLAAFDHATTNEIVVLVLPTLEGHTIEDAAFVTASTWKIGKRGADNGVLLVIAVAERRVRIETGRGIGGVLTDLRASEIIAAMKLALQSGDYDAAIRTALEGIETALRP